MRAGSSRLQFLCPSVAATCSVLLRYVFVNYVKSRLNLWLRLLVHHFQFLKEPHAAQAPVFCPAAASSLVLQCEPDAADHGACGQYQFFTQQRFLNLPYQARPFWQNQGHPSWQNHSPNWSVQYRSWLIWHYAQSYGCSCLHRLLQDSSTRYLPGALRTPRQESSTTQCTTRCADFLKRRRLSTALLFQVGPCSPRVQSKATASTTACYQCCQLFFRG